jgi:hypothetical protein
MDVAIAGGEGGLLDSAGGQILTFAEYRNVGAFAVGFADLRVLETPQV